jgi:hypothetical protein
MLIEIGDLVQHSDGDIGIVLDKMEETGEGMHHIFYLYAIHWMVDGYLKMTRYQNLEVISENK